jgi:hypothetical protein
MERRPWLALLVGLAMLGLTACSDDGLLPLSHYEKVDVNVELMTPSGQSVSLGQVHGAQACGAVAWDYAIVHHFDRSSEWGYVCCTIEHGDQCRHKIR